MGSTEISGALAAQLIDELPVLAAIAPYTRGGIRIRDARELRVKESDRIALVARNLRAMGAEVKEFEDGLDVPGGQQLHGAVVDSDGDHRIAMAFAVAALRAEGDTLVLGADAAAISFPEFFAMLEHVTERYFDDLSSDADSWRRGPWPPARWPAVLPVSARRRWRCGWAVPIFVKSDDPAVLAKAHRDLGYRAAYAPGDLSVTETDRIAGLIREFARQDVVIAEVGAWKNMLDPDPEKRRQNLDTSPGSWPSRKYSARGIVSTSPDRMIQTSGTEKTRGILARSFWTRRSKTAAS